MTGPEDMVEARLYYLERTDQVVSVERSRGVQGRWWVQRLEEYPHGWEWIYLTHRNSLRDVAEMLRPLHPVILLEELW
jgi:hypothetical protein